MLFQTKVRPGTPYRPCVQNPDALYITDPSPIEQTTCRSGAANLAPVAAPIPQPSPRPQLLTHICSFSRKPNGNDPYVPVRFSLTTMASLSSVLVITAPTSSGCIGLRPNVLLRTDAAPARAVV